MKAKNVLIREIFSPEEAADYLDQSDFIYTTKIWIDYLRIQTKGTPVFLLLTIESKQALFVGVIFKKFNIKICGSPFEGWSTPYMGFIGISTFSEEEKYQALKSLSSYILKIKKCHYFQICDWNLSVEFAQRSHFHFDIHSTYMLDLNKSEEELFASFKKDVRTNCRNFKKRGAYLKTSDPSTSFGEDYYKQLVDVFKKQNLDSFYSQERIHLLLEHFSEKNKELILCENVYEPKNNTSIATGIFFGYKNRCYFFGAASYREYQLLRPNEYIIWNSIKYWKSKGCVEMDMLGIRKYKEKFRPSYIERPIIYFQKIPFLHFFKKIFKKILLRQRRLK